MEEQVGEEEVLIHVQGDAMGQKLHRVEEVEVGLHVLEKTGWVDQHLNEKGAGVVVEHQLKQAVEVVQEALPLSMTGVEMLEAQLLL